MNLAELAGLPEEDFAAFLRGFPREKSPGQVHRAERVRDEERGLFIQPEHHEFGEARH